MNVFPSFEEYIAPLKHSPLFQPWTETLENYFRYEIMAVDGGFRSRINPECILEESENLAKADRLGRTYHVSLTKPGMIVA